METDAESHSQMLGRAWWIPWKSEERLVGSRGVMDTQKSLHSQLMWLHGIPQRLDCQQGTCRVLTWSLHICYSCAAWNSSQWEHGLSNSVAWLLVSTLLPLLASVGEDVLILMRLGVPGWVDTQWEGGSSSLSRRGKGSGGRGMWGWDCEKRREEGFEGGVKWISKLMKNKQTNYISATMSRVLYSEWDSTGEDLPNVRNYAYIGCPVSPHQTFKN